MLKLPLERFAEDRLTLAIHIFGFILYSYGFLVPFIIYGVMKIKNRLIYSWIFFTLLLGIWPMIYPPAAPPLWFRWIIFMVYPLAIFSTEGFSNLLFVGSRSKKGVRIITMIYLSFIIFMSSYYIVASPEHAFPYFSDYNPYKVYIQSSMLQSTIPIEDIEPSMQAIKWISKNAHGLVVFHEAFYPWAVICDCLPEKYIIVREYDLSSPERVTFVDVLGEIIMKVEKGSQQVYTIWWTNGKGWYNVPRLPNNFKLEKSFKNIGVYRAELE
ncbi:MAG: hypothetical protein N3E47_05605 [Candidatus Bathyarchaeota archaeon]|nr:hypothetical protein [Candidatus Bathyarchaeota archaeon]